MPSFDITSKVDLQTLDNAINTAKKEISTRYDFKGCHCEIELDKKNMVLKLEIESDMQLKQAEDIILTKAMRQGLDAKCFDISKDHTASGKYVKKDIKIRNGIEQADAKKIVKLIKDSGSKVQAAIMDDVIRVTGKKIDELQEVIALCRSSALELPLQFVNMKS
ncbi:YajQ family cyclic di-GMP-binding protein [Taibaiella sp. KBW10]|uniref:YajQ family cyclic di-GMP-binding protein n=1 Tax=Taibaiella sp. KBW10 TaxID=2153357 RepID=UPI000F5B3EEF|nr:YajQ family cyclic di-GMP-binding protein [Taibaiella sp. KBW10]RQO30922.1 YajQ family cyclic di-GMP-binding protein [Taibaiella sp. KBW10]